MNLVCQLRGDESGLTIRVWEVPAAYEVLPDESWEEQTTAGPGLAALAGIPLPIPAPARAAGA